METTNKLFSEFPPVTKEAWKAKAIEDLKGADFNKKLVWKTDDEFPVLPFYTREDLDQIKWIESQQDRVSRPSNTWTNYTEIEVVNCKKANAQAIELSGFGATGILFVVREPQELNFTDLLEGIDVKTMEISFSTPIPSVHLVSEYFHYLEQKQVPLDRIRGFYECDIIETWSTTGIKPNYCAFAEVFDLVQKAPHFKGLVIRSHSFVNAGASSTQEIAFTLNKLADYFEKLGQKKIKASQLAENLVLHLATGGDYFFEIAKIRATRILVKSILDLYQAGSSTVTILSSNSCWSKSHFDPNVNMLRNTTEAMSAILGGADAILTRAHDVNMQDASKSGKRIALNVSNLLKEESYFDKVKDPSAGSYYIESLTANIADQALKTFREIEDEGGYLNAFTTDIIQKKIAATRSKKENEIALRRRVYVGTNKYPNLLERKRTIEKPCSEIPEDGISLLGCQHATSMFDDLRNRTLDHYEKTGILPRVYLACFGNLAMRKARAGFSTEFFGTAGFDILGEFYFDDLGKAAAESAHAEADIVVICSSDQEYETHAEQFVRTFRKHAPDKLLVLAGYPESIVNDLKEAGIDAFIHIRSNAIELLSEFQQKIFARSMNTGVYY